MQCLRAHKLAKPLKTKSFLFQKVKKTLQKIAKHCKTLQNVPNPYTLGRPTGAAAARQEANPPGPIYYPGILERVAIGFPCRGAPACAPAGGADTPVCPYEMSKSAENRSNLKRFEGVNEPPQDRVA
jgi:hypothetical protein